MRRSHVRKLVWLALIPLAASCVAVQAPPGASRVTWPSPEIPGSLDPRPHYQYGWWPAKELLEHPADSTAGATCLFPVDYDALSAWLKAHLVREATLDGEVRKAAETIQTINATRPGR